MRKPVIKRLYFSLGDSVEQFKLSKYARCQVINHFTARREKKPKHHKQTFLLGRREPGNAGAYLLSLTQLRGHLCSIGLIPLMDASLTHSHRLRGLVDRDCPNQDCISPFRHSCP